eukprot:TRINITY_DN32359_c0_g1_i1.p1 TRINITY_DN32359_c0_g1~~TRINITY_DN32359_c0_g1_i1.p1  ORF type:complete len:184 (-),score=8.26 TRINITY_DN32359_c0_g1_i1:153-704(-)
MRGLQGAGSFHGHPSAAPGNVPTCGNLAMTNKYPHTSQKFVVQEDVKVLGAHCIPWSARVTVGQRNTIQGWRFGRAFEAQYSGFSQGQLTPEAAGASRVSTWLLRQDSPAGPPALGSDNPGEEFALTKLPTLSFEKTTIRVDVCFQNPTECSGVPKDADDRKPSPQTLPQNCLGKYGTLLSPT